MAQRPKKPEPRPAPRLYLVTPPVADANAFAGPLGEALDAGDIACVLLRLAPGDERTLINRAKTLAKLAQAREAALLIDGHAEIVARAGADGAHLAGIDALAASLETLRPDRIAGAGGLTSRHDAMVAAEQNADYVMFGEPDEHGERPAFDSVVERVGWWAEVFEAPCVAYAASLEEVSPLVAAGVDFVALGDAVWDAAEGPAAAVTAAMALLRLPETAA